MTNQDHAIESSIGSTVDKGRFLSLDIFRGLTICLMIIVNSPGKGASLYASLIHAKWFGFTWADLVFPSFLFAVGNALAVSSGKTALISNNKYLLKVFKRTVLIFLIGYLMYWFPFVRQQVDGEWALKPISQTRIMGVLQRIAIAYCFAALLIRYLNARYLIMVSTVILIAYWIVLYIFGEPGQELTMSGNAIRRLDIFLLGEDHVYKKDAMPFDPEGILSTFPAIVNVIAGYLTFQFIQKNGKTMKCFAWLIAIGIALVAIAQGWSFVFPISKKLWTSSFAVHTIGLDVIIISILIYCFEIRNVKFGVYFFSVFGKNPLFIYLLSELAYTILVMIKIPSGQNVFEWISVAIFQQIAPGSLGSLLTGIWFMLMCWLVGWWLDVKKIYIRL